MASSIAAQPVYPVDTGSKPKKPEEGIALCLSGGGYRAMLFHAGVRWRLYETGLLNNIDRISSVSDGSITAAQLGLSWSQPGFKLGTVNSKFIPAVVEPIRKLASKTIDVQSVISGILLSGKISDKVARAY